MSEAVPIARLLAEEGFDTAEARDRAREVLEEAGLTRPGKSAIATEKLARARETLTARLVRVCDDEECRRLAATLASRERGPVAVRAVSCQVCGGSNNRRSAAAMAAKLRERGLKRLLVVGGSPSAHMELASLLEGRGIELRLVNAAEGTHSTRSARPDLEWARVMVVWGATPLPHKVSRLYTDAPPPGLRIVKLARRGIEALCREVLRSLS